MSTFQSTVNINLATGIPGELATDGPVRAQPAIINSGDATQNVIGRAFTYTSATAGDPNTGTPPTVQAGGTGVFAGILMNPKEYPSFGTSANGPLAPTTTLSNYQNGDFLYMGQIFVAVGAACNIGDLLTYNTTTGALGTVPSSNAFTGAVTTTTLTVTAAAAGAALGVGTVVSGAGVPPGTYITALGSGTGGNGTYTLNNSLTISAEAMTGTSVAPAGSALVPHAEIIRYSLAAAGTAIAKLTN